MENTFENKTTELIITNNEIISFFKENINAENIIVYMINLLKEVDYDYTQTKMNKNENINENTNKNTNENTNKNNNKIENEINNEIESEKTETYDFTKMVASSEGITKWVKVNTKPPLCDIGTQASFNDYVKDTNNSTSLNNIEVFEEIGKEYEKYLNNKDKLVGILKENYFKTMEIVNNLNFLYLEKILNENKISFDNNKTVNQLKCELCNYYTCYNKKSLSAHQRGCKKYVGSL